jgi:four helix bundle protein
MRVVPGVRDHTELDAWRLAGEFWRVVQDLLSKRGFHADPDLRDQLRRAARSGPPNIAEGFARYYPRDFARFLRIVNGSMAESVEHLHQAQEQGLISIAERDDACALARRTRGACTRLIVYLESPRADRAAGLPSRRRRRET